MVFFINWLRSFSLRVFDLIPLSTSGNDLLVAEVFEVTFYDLFLSSVYSFPFECLMERVFLVAEVLEVILALIIRTKQFIKSSVQCFNIRLFSIFI